MRQSGAVGKVKVLWVGVWLLLRLLGIVAHEMLAVGRDGLAGAGERDGCEGQMADGDCGRRMAVGDGGRRIGGGWRDGDRWR